MRAQARGTSREREGGKGRVCYSGGSRYARCVKCKSPLKLQKLRDKCCSASEREGTRELLYSACACSHAPPLSLSLARATLSLFFFAALFRATSRVLAISPSSFPSMQMLLADCKQVERNNAILNEQLRVHTLVF